MFYFVISNLALTLGLGMLSLKILTPSENLSSSMLIACSPPSYYEIDDSTGDGMVGVTMLLLTAHTLLKHIPNTQLNSANKSSL